MNPIDHTNIGTNNMTMEYTTNVTPFINCIVEAIAQYEYREISRMAVYERFMGIHDMGVAMIRLNEIEEAIRTLADIDEYVIYRDFLDYYFPEFH